MKSVLPASPFRSLTWELLFIDCNFSNLIISVACAVYQPDTPANVIADVHCAFMNTLPLLWHRCLWYIQTNMHTVSPKNLPCGFLKFFPKRLGIFNQFFTHLLFDPFYTRLRIFIQISLTLTKLCHTKCDHTANFYISQELYFNL